MTAPALPATHLLARLRLIERRVRRAVDERRRTDPAPDDAFRGLYVSDEMADRLLDTATPPPRHDDVNGEGLAVEADTDAHQGEPRLRRLARDFALAPLDVELLLLALLPDVDARFERLYGYLNDDVTRRRASIGLALELCGAAPSSATARGRFTASAPLVAGGLLLVEEAAERPFLSRGLRVPDRVTAHLLGDDTGDTRLAGLARYEEPDPGWRPASAEQLAAAIRDGLRLAYVRERPGAAAQALAAAALAATGAPVLRLDLDALAADPAPEEALAAAAREARLRGGGLVAGPVDALDPAGQPGRSRLLRRLAALAVPVLLTGRTGWDPYWAERSPLLVAAEPMTVRDRSALWWAGFGARPGAPAGADLDAERELAPYLLTPDQVRRAAETAGHRALLEGAAQVGPEHLRAGVRSQNGAGLEKLARRVEPAVGWADLVLPDPVFEQLRELAMRVRHRDRVLGGWRMRPGGGRGRGVTALFAGDSGTGKTMSAEVVAADLGVELYVVDLSTVIDKYVGETEKNLERIFTEAANVNGVLLFDEADAIFGKRSEVRDAHDRYANLESAYLLQRMESFDGVAILTTNLRANLDEAFTRRLDVIVDFPLPDEAQRRALWDRCLGPALPRAEDLDLDFCGRAFELAGGSIRACAVTAAYLAAGADRPVTTDDLMAAVRREYGKLGRLLLDSEFGPHLRVGRGALQER
ncbi:ATP-binding protein [Micromonospora sp. L32]|uniref:ATP-binding protein n=1 Tax=unclassified Micromonospora TaxID=2617518 RepID=UPI003F8CA40C